MKAIAELCMLHGVTAGTGGQTQQLYEWSCSPLDANTSRHTLPDLRYGDDENVAFILQDLFSSDANVDVISIPSTLNCGGTVSAVEYCYASTVETAPLEETFQLFTLLTLEQNGLTFRINDIIPVFSTPTDSICTDIAFTQTSDIRVCCDSMPLNRFLLFQEFELPAPNFAFGIIPESIINHLRYDAAEFPEFRVEQYSFPDTVIGMPEAGQLFSVSGSDRTTNMALRLLKFVISKHSPNGKPNMHKSMSQQLKPQD